MNIRDLYLNLTSKKNNYKEKITYYMALDLEDEKNREAFENELISIKEGFSDPLMIAKKELLKVKRSIPDSLSLYLVTVLSLNPRLTADEMKTAIKYQCTNYTTYRTLLGMAEERELDLSDLEANDVDTVDSVLTCLCEFIEDLNINTAISSGAEPNVFAELEKIKDIFFI